MAPIIDAPKGLIIKKNGATVMESPKSFNVRSPYAFDVLNTGNGECEIGLPFVPLVLPFAISFVSDNSTNYSIPFHYGNVDDNSNYNSSGARRYYFNVGGTIKNFKVWFNSQTTAPTTLIGRVRIGIGNGSASNTLLSVTGSTNQITWLTLEDNDEAHSVAVNIGDWIEFQCNVTTSFGIYNVGGFVEFYYNE